MYSIKIYSFNKKSPFRSWLKKLPTTARARILARIARFEDGNLGDHKKIKQDLFEARFFFGPGYRVYFTIVDRKIVLLLAGGSKSTQTKDISTAKKYLDEYRENKDA